jgi:hypothetical protein
MNLVSDIELIRTDTTLDLSQEAEKSMLQQPNPSPNIHSPFPGPDLTGQCPISANATKSTRSFELMHREWVDNYESLCLQLKAARITQFDDSGTF